MSLQRCAVSDAPLSHWSPCLVEEITGRVVDEYVQAIYMLALAAAVTEDAEAQATLASVAMRLRAQAEAHRALRAPAGDGVMDLADYVGNVCASLSRSTLAEAGVRLAVDADEIRLDAGSCWRVGLIVAELIRDAARHGASDGPGAIWVEIAEASGRIACSVSDDRRRPRLGASSRSRALVRALVAELGGIRRLGLPALGLHRLHRIPDIRGG